MADDKAPTSEGIILPPETSSQEQLKRLAMIVMASPAFQKSRFASTETGWIAWLTELVQLMAAGNNLEQMHAWGRFCWAFQGLRDTQTCHDLLSALVDAGFELLIAPRASVFRLLAFLRQVTVRRAALRTICETVRIIALADIHNTRSPMHVLKGKVDS